MPCAFAAAWKAANRLAAARRPQLGRDQVTQTVGGVIATHTILIGIHPVAAGPIRIVLQRWKALNQPRTAFMIE